MFKALLKNNGSLLKRSTFIFIDKPSLQETMTIQFPEERMKDMFYRDKDKEMAVRNWILSVSGTF